MNLTERWRNLVAGRLCQGGDKLSGKVAVASPNPIVLTRFPCEYE